MPVTFSIFYFFAFFLELYIKVIGSIKFSTNNWFQYGMK